MFNISHKVEGEFWAFGKLYPTIPPQIKNHKQISFN